MSFDGAKAWEVTGYSLKFIYIYTYIYIYIYPGMTLSRSKVCFQSSDPLCKHGSGQGTIFSRRTVLLASKFGLHVW